MECTKLLPQYLNVIRINNQDASIRQNIQWYPDVLPANNQPE